MLIVKKFGGTSVADKERIFNVAKRCIRDYQNGNDVVVVLSAMGKYTDELIAKAKEIIATVSAEKAANLPQQMIENIAKGRLGKFLKEVCLLNQEDIMDGKKTVKETMKEADPELQILAFKRFTLRAE